MIKIVKMSEENLITDRLEEGDRARLLRSPQRLVRIRKRQLLDRISLLRYPKCRKAQRAGLYFMQQ